MGQHISLALRQNIEALADRIGFSSNFLIYDTDDSKRLIKEAMRLLDIDDKKIPVKSVLNEISRAKDRLEGCGDFEKNAGGDFRPEGDRESLQAV